MPTSRRLKLKSTTVWTKSTMKVKERPSWLSWTVITRYKKKLKKNKKKKWRSASTLSQSRNPLLSRFSCWWMIHRLSWTWWSLRYSAMLVEHPQVCAVREQWAILCSLQRCGVKWQGLVRWVYRVVVRAWLFHSRQQIPHHWKAEPAWSKSTHRLKSTLILQRYELGRRTRTSLMSTSADWKS